MLEEFAVDQDRLDQSVASADNPLGLRQTVAAIAVFASSLQRRCVVSLQKQVDHTADKILRPSKARLRN